MTTSNVSHNSKFVGELKKEYEAKIEELNSTITSLQEELDFIMLSKDRVYDV